MSVAADSVTTMACAKKRKNVLPSSMQTGLSSENAHDIVYFQAVRRLRGQVHRQRARRLPRLGRESPPSGVMESGVESQSA